MIEEDKREKKVTNLSRATTLQTKNVTATPWSGSSSSPACWPTVPVSDETRKKGDKLCHTNSNIKYAFLASISTSDCGILAFSDSLLRHLKFSRVSDIFPHLLPCCSWSRLPIQLLLPQAACQCLSVTTATWTPRKELAPFLFWITDEVSISGEVSTSPCF